jgi:DNA-binding transcriptional LysR family regulator
LKKLDAGIRDGSTTLSEIGLTPDIDHEVIHATAQHLLRYWGPPVPARRHPREREVSSVAVLHGFEEVASTLGGLSYPFVSEEERWIVDNRSKQGLHAMVHSPLGRWLSVGSLVAFRDSDNATWTAGLVRRLARENDDTRMVAVEALARGGAGVTVLPHPSPRRQTEGTLCVLLPGPNGVGEEVRLLLPPNRFSESAPLVMHAYERRYLLIPVRLIENSVDCQVGSYKILRPAD